MASTYEMFYNEDDKRWDVVQRPENVCVFFSADESEATDYLDEHDPDNA